MDTTKEEILSVTAASRLVKNVIDHNLAPLWIKGEISNYVHHSSGHIYFSLKDDNSTIKCAFFRQYNLSLSFKPKNGDQILCFGKIDVYEKTGTYQLLARSMLPAGIGELQLKFLALKKKLEEEGLFATEGKKALPPFPESVGVITSPTGAAFQDIKNVITRRYPHKLYLYPAGVQGDSSVPELVAGLEYFNSELPVDIIIIGRGGGSQEDLFCFNDERLARAIFASRIPVISAVGHEIDFTIADFVADLRAPTPSAAAELAVPNKTDLLAKIEGYRKQLVNETAAYILLHRKNLNSYEKTLYQWHPRNVLFKYQQRYDEAVNFFTAHLSSFSAVRNNLDRFSSRLLYLTGRVSAENIAAKKLLLRSYDNRLTNATRNSLETKKTLLTAYKEQMKALSPRQALKRGYAILRKEQQIINSVKSLKLQDTLELLLKDGNCNCTIDKITPTREDIPT